MCQVVENFCGGVKHYEGPSVDEVIENELLGIVTLAVYAVELSLKRQTGGFS